MSLGLDLQRHAGLALYRQIADQIKDRICDGRLPAGARLPTVRQMAADAGVTRLTVQNAYGELQGDGWIEATVGRGTFVSSTAGMHPELSEFGRDVTPDAVIQDIVQLDQVSGVRSLASASPDASLFPGDEFWAAIGSLKDDAASMASYGPSQGDPQLRVELAEWLRGRGFAPSPDEILITAGAAQGLSLVAQALARPGDTVIVERPTYLGILHTLRMQGIEPLSVPLDDEGPRLELLERLIVQQRPRFFYTVPSFQNPTGMNMSAARRSELVTLCRRHGVLVVEDDLYGRLAYDAPPPPALKSLDQADLVVHIGSFSKIFMPGLRIGYVVAPPLLHERLLSLRRAADLCSPTILQRALVEFMRSGGLKRHLRRVLPVYKSRRDRCMSALRRHMPREVEWTRPKGGFCTWLTLPERYPFDDLQQAMLEHGWAFAPGEAFLTEAESQYHLRLCFGNQDADVTRTGVELLGRLIQERMERVGANLPEFRDWTPIV